MDKIFQYVCDLYPAYKIDTKFKKKLFYIFFSLLKFFLKGPFVMNFEKIQKTVARGCLRFASACTTFSSAKSKHKEGMKAAMTRSIVMKCTYMTDVFYETLQKMNSEHCMPIV